MPVTRHPPHSPGREVFPHPVPRLYSLPRRRPRAACLLLPAVRFACVAPILQCPAQVSFAGCVLPSGPSPCSWISHAQSTMPDKTPPRLAAGFPFHSNPPPARSESSSVRLDSRIVPFPGFPFCASLSVCPTSTFPLAGNPRGFPSSLTCLFLHAAACGLRRTFASSPIRVLLCCLRCTLKPSASATSLSRSCTSTSECASPLRPTGFSVYASPVLFAVFRPPRHRRKTRYRWVANPYPTGTFTPQETSSFTRRYNAADEKRPEGVSVRFSEGQ